MVVGVKARGLAQPQQIWQHGGIAGGGHDDAEVELGAGEGRGGVGFADEGAVLIAQEGQGPGRVLRQDEPGGGLAARPPRVHGLVNELVEANASGDGEGHLEELEQEVDFEGGERALEFAPQEFPPLGRGDGQDTEELLAGERCGDQPGRCGEGPWNRGGGQQPEVGAPFRARLDRVGDAGALVGPVQGQTVGRVGEGELEGGRCRRGGRRESGQEDRGAGEMRPWCHTRGAVHNTGGAGAQKDFATGPPLDYGGRAMWLTPLLASLIFAVCAGASFFFAVAETSLFTLSKWQTRHLAERDPVRGGAVTRLLGTPHDLLATIVLGNTFANAGLVALGLGLGLREGGPFHLILPGVFLMILMGGEVIPKTLAVRAPEFWALRVARLMTMLQAASRPVRRVAQRLNQWLLARWVSTSIKPAAGTTEEDYAELLELAYQQGTLAEAEKEIILQIINLDRRTARDVMRPRAQMVCLSDDLSVAEMVAAARRHKHRRLPLYDESPDTIVGVLNTRRLLLEPEGDLAEAIEFPSFVPESINLLQLLKSLQRQQRGLAIVLDEYGTTAGLVTTEDILESMVGRIRSEGEAEGFVMERLGPGRWRVSGTMRVEDFRREYRDLLEVAEVDTMGGLMVAQAGVVPLQGHAVVVGGVRLTATQADERRVRELVVELVKPGRSSG